MTEVLRDSLAGFPEVDIDQTVVVSSGRHSYAFVSCPTPGIRKVVLEIIEQLLAVKELLPKPM